MWPPRFCELLVLCLFGVVHMNVPPWFFVMESDFMCLAGYMVL